MAGTIDRATLDRLIALGRQRGELTASDLQAVLPVEALDVDALVLVMLELEEAGISVEPDAFGARTGTVAPGLILPSPDPGPVPVPGRAVADRRWDEAARPASLAEAEAAGEEAAEEDVGRVVLLAGLAVVLVLGTILVLI